MKSVLISIRPGWCHVIASGKKTIELRKSKPKLETNFKVYIYCTKDEPMYRSGDKFWCPNDDCGNGKVIGEFICNHVEEYVAYPGNSRASYFLTDEEFRRTAIEALEDIFEYGDGATLYGWHISDLVIYDHPRKLSDFEGLRKTKFGYEPIKIKRPPQSWCYVEEVSR